MVRSEAGGACFSTHITRRIQEANMVGMTIAATLGFALGATFKSSWILIQGAIAAASSAATYTLVMQAI